MEHRCSFAASPYVLRDLQLFRDTADDAMAAALADCAVVRLAAGELLAEPAHARLYIVLRGALDIAVDANSSIGDGSASRVVAGESVGEQSVLDDAINLAAITASEETELLVIEADLVWQLIDQSNVLARNLLRLLSFRIRTANAMLRRRHKLGEFYRQLSMNDGLTGLYNRAWLSDMLPRMVANAERGNTPLSLVMIDLDHFKKFNDTHGHVSGDDALRAAAGLIGGALRPSDYAVRYGGEEMLVILPDTASKLARMVAERLCQRMREVVVFQDMRVALPHLTGSFGVASLTQGLSDTGLVAAADAALYRAKLQGRDRVAC